MRVEAANAELACALQKEGLALLLLLPGGGIVNIRVSHLTSSIHGSFVLFTRTISDTSGATLRCVLGLDQMSLRLLGSLCRVHPMY